MTDTGYLSAAIKLCRENPKPHWDESNDNDPSLPSAFETVLRAAEAYQALQSQPQVDKRVPDDLAEAIADCENAHVITDPKSLNRGMLIIFHDSLEPVIKAAKAYAAMPKGVQESKLALDELNDAISPSGITVGYNTITDISGETTKKIRAALQVPTAPDDLMDVAREMRDVLNQCLQSHKNLYVRAFGKDANPKSDQMHHNINDAIARFDALTVDNSASKRLPQSASLVRDGE